MIPPPAEHSLWIIIRHDPHAPECTILAPAFTKQSSAIGECARLNEGEMDSYTYSVRGMPVSDT